MFTVTRGAAAPLALAVGMGATVGALGTVPEVVALGAIAAGTVLPGAVVVCAATAGAAALT